MDKWGESRYLKQQNMKKQEIVDLVKSMIVEGRLNDALKYLLQFVKGNERYLETDLSLIHI